MDEPLNAREVLANGDSDDDVLSESGLFMPPSYADAIFHGPAGAYAQQVSPFTEAHPIGVLVASLVAFGNAVNQNRYITVGVRRHYLNEGVLLIGPTGVGRKNEAQDVALEPFMSADEVWASTRQLGGFGSGEALVEEVCDPITKLKRNEQGVLEEVVAREGALDKRLLVHESEFSHILAVAGREGSTLSQNIRNAFDSKRLQNRTRGGGKIVATNAHISFIAGITPGEFVSHITSVDLANGLVNRFLLVAVKRLHLLPNVPIIPETIIARAADAYREALDFTRTNAGALTLSAEARELYAHLYVRRLSVERRGILQEVCSRAETHVLRLASIYASLDRSEVIGAVHVQAAFLLWRYCEESARVVFQLAPEDSRLGRLLSALSEKSDGLTRRELHALFDRNLSAGELDDLVGLAEDLGHVESRKGLTGSRGRPAEVVALRVRTHEQNESERTNASLSVEDGFVRTFVDTAQPDPLESHPAFADLFDGNEEDEE